MIPQRSRSTAFLGPIVALLCVAYQSLFRAIPSNGDVLLGLPIAKEFLRPGLYSPHDLLISSGIRGPYHFYKYLGAFLYQSGVNVDLAWQGLFLCALFLTFLSFWFLAIELTHDARTSALFLSIVAVAHPLRGSLHAAAVPLAAFVTASAAMPLAITAIVLLLRKRRFAAMAVSCAVFNLHPYVGLLAAAAIGMVILLERELPMTVRLRIILGGAIFAIPNVAFILLHLPSNFSAPGFDFYAQFRNYALHAFVETHWREGYGWFAMCVAAAVIDVRQLSTVHQRALRILMGAWFGMMLLYVVNAYLLKNMAVMLMFLFRATYFTKPILFVIIIHGLSRRYQRIRLLTGAPPPFVSQFWMGTALLFLSAILPMRNAVVADCLAVMAFGFVWSAERTSRRINPRYLVVAGGGLTTAMLALLTAPATPFAVLMESILVGLVLAVGVVVGICEWQSSVPAETDDSAGIAADSSGRWQLLWPALAVLAFHQLIVSANDRHLPFVPDWSRIGERMFMHRATPSTDALFRWAKTDSRPASMFALPPGATEEFGAFRLIAERGVYCTTVEVNQLAFDATVYRLADERLRRLGTRMPARQQFDTRGYYERTRSEWQAICAEDHVDYAIFERARWDRSLTSAVAYEDTGYAVVDLRRLSR